MQIVKNPNTNGIGCTFNKGDKYYHADLSYTIDCGYECMIFPCTENGEITSWQEVFVDWFDGVKEEYLLDCVTRFRNS